MDDLAGNPAGLLGREKGDDAADVVRLGETLQRLQPQGEGPAALGLGEVRHVCLDDSGRHRVDPDSALPEERSEMSGHGLDRPLGGAVGGQQADDRVRGERRDEDDAGAASKDRQELLDEEEGRPDVDREQPVKILDRRVLDPCGF